MPLKIFHPLQNLVLKVLNQCIITDLGKLVTSYAQFQSFLQEFTWFETPQYYDYIYCFDISEEGKVWFTMAQNQNPGIDVNGIVSKIKIVKQTSNYEKGQVCIEYNQDCYEFINNLERKRNDIEYEIFLGDFLLEHPSNKYEAECFTARTVFKESPFPFRDKDANLCSLIIPFGHHIKSSPFSIVFYGRGSSALSIARKLLLENASQKISQPLVKVYYEKIIVKYERQRQPSLPRDKLLWTWFPTLLDENFLEKYRDFLC
jgi:hypothetical protein